MSTSPLRDALYALYSNDDAILDLFDQLDFTILSVKFQSELDSRISKDDQKIAQLMLQSELLNRYDLAVKSATMACTNQISELLTLVTMQPDEKGLH